jgi:hypothetical protein
MQSLYLLVEIAIIAVLAGRERAEKPIQFFWLFLLFHVEQWRTVKYTVLGRGVRIRQLTAGLWQLHI